MKLTDAGGTVTTSSFSVTVDNTKPTAVDVQTTNVSGGTAGKPELGDTVTLTYSERNRADLDPVRLERRRRRNVVVRVNDGISDTVQICERRQQRGAPARHSRRSTPSTTSA